jgi:hypothetical protein
MAFSAFCSQVGVVDGSPPSGVWASALQLLPRSEMLLTGKFKTNGQFGFLCGNLSRYTPVKFGLFVFGTEDGSTVTSPLNALSGVVRFLYILDIRFCFTGEKGNE